MVYSIERFFRSIDTTAYFSNRSRLSDIDSVRSINASEDEIPSLNPYCESLNISFFVKNSFNLVFIIFSNNFDIGL